MVQTATNPDTNERVALIGGQWQPVLKSATNGSGVKAYLIGDKWITDDGATPSRPTPVIAPQQPKLNSDILPNIGFGVVMEPFAKMASGMIAKPLSEIAGVAAAAKDRITGNIEGDPTGFKNYIQGSLTYQPRTVAGASNLNPINALNNAVGAGLEWAGGKAAGLVEDPNREAYSARNVIANALREAVPQAIGIGMVKAAPTITKKVGEYQIAKAIEKGAAEQEFLVRQAGLMKTAKEGVGLGLSADPAAMNPTVSNRVQSTMTGPESIVKVASGRNTKVLPSIAKRQMGIEQGVSLAGDEGKAAVAKALAVHDAPYAQVAALPEIVVSPEALQSIQALKQTPILGAKADAIAANSVIDDAVAGLKPQRDSLTNSIKYQRSPAQILTDIQQLREKAQKVFESSSPTTAQTATAKTQWALAKRLEGLIDDTVGATNPNLLQSLRDARVAKAQIHAWRDAITPEGKIDTQSLVKRLVNDDLLTGEIKTVAEFASAFPKAMGLKSAEAQTLALDHAKRWGLGGLVGYGVGHLVGQPVIGGIVGAAVGEGAGTLNAMRLTNKGVQNANALSVSARLANRTPPSETRIELNNMASNRK